MWLATSVKLPATSSPHAFAELLQLIFNINGVFLMRYLYCSHMVASGNGVYFEGFIRARRLTVPRSEGYGGCRGVAGSSCKYAHVGAHARGANNRERVVYTSGFT